MEVSQARPAPSRALSSSQLKKKEIKTLFLSGSDSFNLMPATNVYVNVNQSVVHVTRLTQWVF